MHQAALWRWFSRRYTSASPIAAFSRCHPEAQAQIFVDDIILGSEGPPDQVRDVLTEATEDLLRIVPEELHSGVAYEKMQSLHRATSWLSAFGAISVCRQR